MVSLLISLSQAKACHPDRNRGDAAQKAFIRVQEAWDVLKVRWCRRGAARRQARKA